MTRKVKKIFACSLLLCHHMGFAGDKPEETIFTIVNMGIASLAATALAGAGWYGLAEYQKQVEIDLNEKAIKLIAITKNLLAEKSKYAPDFDVFLSESVQNEAVLESCAAKVGISIDRIKQYQRYVIPEDINELAMLEKELRSLGLASRPDVANAHRNVTLHLENAKKLSAIIERHKVFFDSHAALNFYTTLPTKEADITDWIYGHAQSELYPLLSYKDVVDRELSSMESRDMSQYPKLAKKCAERKELMKKSLAYLYKTGKIQLEAQKKHDNEIQVNNVRIAQERKQIEFVAADAQKRNADALMISVRNTEMVQANERNKIAAQAEQNRVALLRLPIDQENNRLIAERNRLNAESNRAVAEQNRLQAERIRVESINAENKAKEILALEVQNKLQKERNQLERERKEREDAAVMPTPSAPPMPANYQQQIPTATAVPIDPNSTNVYPQATAVRYIDSTTGRYVDQYGRPL